MGREMYSSKGIGKGKDRRITGHKSSIGPRGEKRVIALLFLSLWL